jgi:hypothetical protein
MYRTLGTRGTVFGVPSGPYASSERTVAFRRLPRASRKRFVDALGGKVQLAPILRSALGGARLHWPGILLCLLTLVVLVCRGWPAAEPRAFVLAYAILAVVLALTARRSLALSHGGTSIPSGTYLFPLDVVDVRRDGTLRLTPIGSLREAAVTTEGQTPALALTFKDGTVKIFPVATEREAESAYAALESAQQTLEKLTYGSNLSDAVNLDPFFEVRVDDTWHRARALQPSTGAAVMAATALAAACAGAGLFVFRNDLAARAHEERRARMAAEIAALQARLAQQEEARAAEARRAREDEKAEERAADRPAWQNGGAVGLDAYKAVAPSPEMGAIVEQLAKAGSPLQVYFHETLTPCAADAACAPVPLPPLAPMESRLVAAFAQVFSQTVPTATLPRPRLMATRPSSPALTVDVTLTATSQEPQAIAMTFDVKLDVPPHAAKVFRLTMPPPSTALTQVRDRSLFTLADHPAPADLVYARGLDRLYDEIYGIFFTGPPRVPVPDASEDLRREFERSK